MEQFAAQSTASEPDSACRFRSARDLAEATREPRLAKRWAATGNHGQRRS